MVLLILTEIHCFLEFSKLKRFVLDYLSYRLCSIKEIFYLEDILFYCAYQK